MAKKIPQLDDPTIPLTGDEIMELSQSDVSVKVTVDQLGDKYNELFTEDIDLSAQSVNGSMTGINFTSLGDILPGQDDEPANFASDTWKGKMWKIGGITAGNVMDPGVYTSVNGEDWEHIGSISSDDTSVVGFYFETDTLTVYKDKLWIVAPLILLSPPTRTNKVYSSVDGLYWEYVGDIPLVFNDSTYIRFTEVVSFDNKLWVFAGKEDGGTEVVNKIYYSEDGVTWTEAGTDSYPGGSKSHATVLSFDDKMWVIGGNPNNGDPIAQTVYYSTDGITWTEAGSDILPWPLTGSKGIVYDNKMWLLNTAHPNAFTQTKDGIYSSDGTEWTIFTSDFAYDSGKVIVHDGRVFVLGGHSGFVYDEYVYKSVLAFREGVDILDAGLKLASGTRVDEFSTDGTLVGNSDTAVPTEKAVVTYVGSQIAARDEHNELFNIQGGDSTSEYYHLTKAIHDGLYSASPIIGLGDSAGTRIEVDYGSNTIVMEAGGKSLGLTSSGMSIGVNDTARGILDIYGDEGGVEPGGEIKLYISADYDATHEYYIMRAYEANFFLGTNVSSSLLWYSSSANEWEMNSGLLTLKGGTPNTINLGAGSSQRGLINIYGPATGIAEGGELYLHIGDDHNNLGITNYSIKVYEDDLLIGPDSDTDALKYDGANNVWQFTRAETRFGTEDSITEGLITVYGDNSNAGGRLQLHLGAGYDTTIPYYQIRGFNDDLYIGPSTDIDALKYDGGLNVWQFTRYETVFGLADSVSGGKITIHSDNSTNGGMIQLHTGPAYDTTILYYQIRPFEDDFHIGPSSDPDALKYDGALNLWNFTRGETRFGTADSPLGGQLTVYSDDSSNGGKLNLHTGPAYDTTITHYHIGPFNDDLYIGPSTDWDALKYDGGTNQWIFNPVLGNNSVRIGVDGDPSSGELHLEGSNTDEGGRIAFYTGTGFDTIIPSYHVLVSEDDLNIGPGTDIDALKYDGANNVWQFTRGETRFGTADSVSGGQITIYSDNSNTGGTIQLHTGPSYDTTITHYQIRPDNDDLIIGPSTDIDALKYDGSLNQWQFTPAGGVLINSLISPVSVGTTDTTGDVEIILYVNADYDTIIDSYNIQTFEDDLYIGPNTDTDALKYDGGNNRWVFPTGKVDFGVDGIAGGDALINVYAGNNDEATLRLYNNPDYDNTVEYYQFRTTEGWLEIGPNVNADALKYDDAAAQWIMNAVSGTRINNGLNLDGTLIAATAAELNTKEFTIHIPDLSDATAEISFVSNVAGTVSKVHSSVEGDPGADTIISGNVNGGAEFSATITIANGSAQHDADAMTVADNNVITAGQTVRLITDGGAVNAVGAWLTVVILL